MGPEALVGALVLENSTEFCAENLRPRAACGTETHGSRNSETHGSGYGDSELPGAACLLRWVRYGDPELPGAACLLGPIYMAGGGSCCGGIGIAGGTCWHVGGGGSAGADGLGRSGGFYGGMKRREYGRG